MCVYVAHELNDTGKLIALQNSWLGGEWAEIYVLTVNESRLLDVCVGFAYSPAPACAEVSKPHKEIAVSMDDYLFLSLSETENSHRIICRP